MLVLDARTKVAGGSLIYFLCALALSAYSARHPDVVSTGAALVSEGLRPFRSVTNGLSVSIKGVYSAYVELVGVKAENAELLDRVQTLEAANSRLLEVESENERLRSLLAIGDRAGLRGVAAQVVGRDATNWVQTITLNRGSSAGIERGMPVLVGDGVVGQVVSVSPSTAIVLLMTDHSSGIDAIVQGSRARGVVEGTGKELCRWRFVLREAAVNIGDRVITSGLDGIYPKGLLLGVVTEIEDDGGLFHSISIRPAAAISSIEDVLVVTSGGKQAVQSKGGE
ncbi:MAG: cell shape-determining protein MreC [Pseudomonadota bacterium]|jgi:rod shape-determining protein MreC